MKTAKIGNVILGEGRTKIIAPIAGRAWSDIEAKLPSFLESKVDIAELRIDYLNDLSSAVTVINKTKEALCEMPLLVTLRSAKEGGNAKVDAEDYKRLLLEITAKGKADAIDVELFMGKDVVPKIIEEAHKKGITIVASNHDFTVTPQKQEITDRLLQMQKMGADVLKIAVMPTCEEDVITLMEATREAYNKAQTPIISMSMGQLGVCTRLMCKGFGSCASFGAVKEPSAPGQVGVGLLSYILNF